MPDEWIDALLGPPTTPEAPVGPDLDLGSTRRQFGVPTPT